MTGYMATGDPFLGGVLKGIGKVAKGAIGGFLGGGPIGAITGGIGALAGGGRPISVPMPISRALPPVTGITGQIGFPAGPQIGGGISFGPRVPQIAGPAGVPAGSCPPTGPRGYHLNKSGYFLKSGQYVPPGTRWVRNRRMNPANGRALRRSISRAKSFDNLVKRNRKNLRALARI